MSKFILPFLFMFVSISWLYHDEPFEADHELIEKYRPSLNHSPDAILNDSIYPVKLKIPKKPTALHQLHASLK